MEAHTFQSEQLPLQCHVQSGNKGLLPMDQKHSSDAFNPKTKRQFLGLPSDMSRGLENGWNSSYRIPYFHEC